MLYLAHKTFGHRILDLTDATSKPPNVKFEVDDAEAPWTHATPFDLIFARQLDGSISDWPALIGNMFKCTRPGGWTE